MCGAVMDLVVSIFSHASSVALAKVPSLSWSTSFVQTKEYNYRLEWVSHTVHLRFLLHDDDDCN